MPAFQTLKPYFSQSQLRDWYDNVDADMPNHPGKYWERFNTIRIPILDEDDFLKTAIEIAKRAKGSKAEFERLFKERNAKQKQKLIQFMSKTIYQTIYHNEIFPCKDAKDTVYRVGLTGCLLDFLLLLNGIAFGWEADMSGDVHSDSDTESLVDRGSLDPCANDEAGIETQWNEDDFYYETPMERQKAAEETWSAAYYMGTSTYTRCTTPPPAGPTFGPNDPAIDPLVSEKKTRGEQGKRKRDHLDDDVSDTCGRHRKRRNIMPTSIPHATIEQATDRSATGENSTLGNDNVSKRRKLKSPPILEQTSINSSSQLAADKGAVKKRSRHHDCDDQEHRQKRQRTSQTSSSIQQLTDEKVAVKKSRPKDKISRGCSSQKRKKSSLNTLLAPTFTKTRSVKRKGGFTFWELDHLGNPRSL
ncbi:hypothetical protein V8C35DRAFT_316365 [Trichoderma chlorosporum]